MSLFKKPIALDPKKGGGLCIDQRALEPADLIVSTTQAGVSRGIRIGTSSSVSHATLYIGDGEVIEAVGEGVVRQTLTAALADDALAVAYRAPGMNAAIAGRIIQYAISQMGQPYSAGGALLSANGILCRIAGGRGTSFFCSQLVFEAYRRGGLPLTQLPSHCITPQDAVIVAESHLIYVGHLLGNPAWFPVISP